MVLNIREKKLQLNLTALCKITLLNPILLVELQDLKSMINRLHSILNKRCDLEGECKLFQILKLCNIIHVYVCMYVCMYVYA